MKEVHLICNAHLDPIWQWDWPEGVGAVLSTFRSAADLSDRFDYIFCHNEVTLYRYVEEYAPSLFEKIRSLVQQGRWHIMGGWYLQPDCNMPCGESFVRQIQVGRQYFRENFGVDSSTAINFDPFGHSVGLVQIIRKCGQNSMICTRPYRNELPLASDQFWWEGLDGSRIKVYRADGYNSPLGASAEMVERKAKAEPQNVVCVLWGVGNHGGGPSAKDLQDIKTLQENSEMRFIHSTPERFFEKIQPREVVRHSLRPTMPGCYTTMSLIKKKHVELENQLYLTEKLVSVASLKGLLEYPHERLNEVTEDLLNAQFHDVLPGSSVRAGEDNGLKLLDHGLLEVEKLKTRGFFALSKREQRAAEGEYPILVFNPNPYEYETEIECEFMLADQNWSEDILSSLSVYDSTGNKLSCQVVKEESNLNLDWRKKIVFLGKLKPLDITRFSVFAEYTPKAVCERSQNFVYDQGDKYVEIDASTGLLKSFSLRGREYVANAFALSMYDTTPDPYSMSEAERLHIGEGKKDFILMQNPYGVFGGMQSVQVCEDGDIYKSVECFFSCENSQARVEYRIYKQADYIDVNIDVFCGDANKIIRAAVPVPNGGTLVGQTAYGCEELFMNGQENVSQRFIALRKGENCLAIFNNCNYGSCFENGAVHLSLVRSATYCAHPILDRPIIPPDRFTKKIDMGERNFSFRIAVCGMEEAERMAQEFNQRPYAVNVFPLGEPGRERPFALRISDKNIVLTAFKQSATSSSYVLRLFNNTENSVTCSVAMNGSEIDLCFGKYEVKTILWHDGLIESEEMII